MGRLARETYPNLVLFGPLGREKGIDGHSHEEGNDTQLNVGVERETLYHLRLAVGDGDEGCLVALRPCCGLSQVYAHGVAGALHRLVGLKGVSGSLERRGEVARINDAPFGIGHDDRYCVVALQHLQYQGHVGPLVRRGERLHGGRPYLHTPPLLVLQVLGQDV